MIFIDQKYYISLIPARVESRDQGSGIRDQGSEIRVQESGIRIHSQISDH